MTSQRRRPSSANSISSRASASLQSDGELKLECRAVFLSRYDDIKDNIESKDELIMRMYIFLYYVIVNQLFCIFIDF